MTVATVFTLRAESPDQAEVRALLAELDVYLGGLYAPEHNHILDVEALLAPEVSFLVARHAGRAVGCGAARRMPGEAATQGHPYGEIKRMYVRPACRGQRLGEQLLAELEDGLKRRGLELALLETGDAQPEALRLYERCGYVRRAPFGGYEDNGTSLFYEKRLA
ncbi:GNAT family N-acetyltransferase [uncultured Piscinibacter sp.]|uniref:GNAT family N-acetyltransferase n=1 Tax=uncultured Piscinibacter sp. TaxID=1131835 RepID=UPI00262050F1|nr:GNAT family N-acetyltransferase [uncultured Piscinibacter sp.]